MVGRWWDGRSTHIAETGEESKRTHTTFVYGRGEGERRGGGRETITSYPSVPPSLPRGARKEASCFFFFSFAASIQQTYETRLHGAILYTYEKPKASDCRLPSSYWPRMNVRGNLFPFFSIPPISPSFCPYVVPLRKRREGEEKAICLQSLLSPSFSSVPLSFSLGRDIHLLSSLPPSDSQGGRGGGCLPCSAAFSNTEGNECLLCAHRR